MSLTIRYIYPVVWETMEPNLGQFGLLRMNLNQMIEVWAYIIHFYMILLVVFSENAIAIVFEYNMCVYFYL